MGLLHFYSESIILSNFKELEQTQISGVIGQVQIALTDEINAYQNKVHSWAQTKEIVNYIKANQGEGSNMSPEALDSWVTLGVNYILAYNNEGQCVTNFGFNLTTYQKESIPTNLLKEISENPNIWRLGSIDSAAKGILLIPQGPLMVVSSPIPPENSGGSMQGALVFARYLDDKEIASLSRTVQLPISLTRYSEAQIDGNQLECSPAAMTYSTPIDTNYIVGYYVVKDLTNQPALLLGVTIPRTVYLQGVITLNYIDRLMLVSCVVFSVIIVLLLEFLVLSKLSKLTNAVSNLSHRKNPSLRLPTNGNDEIDTLTKSINNMLSEIEDNSKKLQKVERFSAIGELATMIAHDLRNPLQGIANAAFYLKRKTTAQTSGQEKQMLELIQQDVHYSDKIINDLLDYGRELRPDLQEATPRQLLWRALSTVTVPEKIRIDDQTGDEPAVMVDVDSINRVFTNMITNAIDAMPNGGTLTVKCQSQNGRACFIFSDTGVGMTQETLKKLFQPLFTTKAKGMGFGLSICKRIVDAHRGRIVAESVLGKGTSFKIYLPLAKPKEKL
jgi:signal transduction histidine kinase